MNRELQEEGLQVEAVHGTGGTVLPGAPGTPDLAPAPVKAWTQASLQAAALHAAEHWSALHRPAGSSGFSEEAATAGAALNALMARVDAAPSQPGDATDPFLDIRENSRLLRSAVNEARAGRRVLERLPRLAAEGDAQQLRVAAVAESYFAATQLAWDADALRIFLDEAQKTEPLELDELWSLPALMKFALAETVLSEAEQLPAGAAEARPRIQRAIKSMRELGYADWSIVAEPLIAFDATLQQDPAGAYTKMDFDSREAYRKRVAAIARYSECSELQVAAMALELAREAHRRRVEDPRLHTRRAHIGYYLVDRGAEQLSERVGYRPPLAERLRITARRDADLAYIAPIEVISVVLIAAILLPLIPGSPSFMALIAAFVLLLLPVTQGAVDLLNNIVTALFEARALPKLDFSKGVPREFSTLVAVPTLLLSEKQLRELVGDLEVRYLANQDPNLHFALITDLPDALTKPRESDRDPLVDLAVKLIDELNARYASGANGSRGGSFVLFHRHRIFNARQGVWMGWERKRGKLLDLNKYLQGVFDAFPVKAGDVEAVHGVKYIITLDSDTQLPRGTAQSLVGAMAHPLNRAVIDPTTRIVTAGYGILQPRVGVSVQSASRSRLAALYSGQTGFDIYTRAVSDVYQDLYGEGIFTGKGIYEVETLHAVLDRRFPRNALLSHDLIEGAYARAGLATDIEVIDDYPSHYSAYTRRKHRWVRGDWQIAQWLFAVVPDESGRRVRNPISTISRWKIFDNLRRSLVDPFTLLLLIAGWLWLPGGPLYWTVVTVLLMFLPTLVQLVFSLGRAIASDQPGVVRDAIEGFGQAAFITLLNLVYLPHTTMLSLDAILRALIRRFVTGQRLLEWETAAESEAGVHKVTPVDRYLAGTPLFALAMAALLFLGHRHSLLVAFPILLIWACAGVLTAWLNNPPREKRRALSREEMQMLRQHALRIWRYFYEFGSAKHNYLLPDNVEEKDLFEAARVSPTNLGLLLNARQAAVEFGFLTVPEFADLTTRSLATLARLEKHRGHLYNWYDTGTLAPLLPITVSSVDSGNFAASLYTLRMGAAELLGRPLLTPSLFAGLRAQMSLCETNFAAMPSAASELEAWRPGEGGSWSSEVGQAMDASITWALAVAPVAVAIALASADESSWWQTEQQTRLRAIATIVHEYMPWLLPEFATLRQVSTLSLKDGLAYPCIGNTMEFIDMLDEQLARAWATHSTDGVEGSALIVLGERLRTLLPAVRERLQALIAAVRRCSDEAFRLANEMDFGFLVQKDRQLLSIGYEVATGVVHSASYDMLASEARIATFLAIANGEMMQQSWFKLGRTHTFAFRHAVLLSWTGTMFEYLMPSLWMRSFPDTLMARTLSGVVAIQRAFGRRLDIPWGISESGYAQVDDGGHYHYQAFGIPEIALKWDATAGPVVSPYSSYLALGIDPMQALSNIRRMVKAGWMGAYGLYEAADYEGSMKQPQLVREWMAHHQGMSLLAILNLLEDAAVQRWFHANPHLQATELLLHEKPIREATLEQEFKAMPARRTPAKGAKDKTPL